MYLYPGGHTNENFDPSPYPKNVNPINISYNEGIKKSLSKIYSISYIKKLREKNTQFPNILKKIVNLTGEGYGLHTEFINSSWDTKEFNPKLLVKKDKKELLKDNDIYKVKNTTKDTNTKTSTKSNKYWVPLWKQNLSPIDYVESKVKGILNKITASNYVIQTNKLVKWAKENIKNSASLYKLAETIYMKAISEKMYVKMYAELSHGLKEAMSEFDFGPNSNFERCLLSVCQKDFEKDFMSDNNSIGKFNFISELFIVSVISEKIIHSCIQKLLYTKYETARDMHFEYLFRMLSIVGCKLNNSSNPLYKSFFDSYIKHIRKIDQESFNTKTKCLLLDLNDQIDNKFSDSLYDLNVYKQASKDYFEKIHDLKLNTNENIKKVNGNDIFKINYNFSNRYKNIRIWKKHYSEKTDEEIDKNINDLPMYILNENEEILLEIHSIYRNNEQPFVDNLISLSLEEEKENFYKFTGKFLYRLYSEYKIDERHINNSFDLYIDNIRNLDEKKRLGLLQILKIFINSIIDIEYEEFKYVIDRISCIVSLENEKELYKEIKNEYSKKIDKK